MRALSIEVNPAEIGPEISQVIDMEGRVYNGHFGLSFGASLSGAGG